MFSIYKGSLSMSSDDLDKIQERVKNGDSPKQALTNELNSRGMNIKDIFDIVADCFNRNGEILSSSISERWIALIILG